MQPSITCMPMPCLRRSGVCFACQPAPSPTPPNVPRRRYFNPVQSESYSAAYESDVNMVSLLRQQSACRRAPCLVKCPQRLCMPNLLGRLRCATSLLCK